MKIGQTTTTKTGFIVSAKCHEAKAFDDHVMTKEDTEVWLGEENHYPSWSTWQFKYRAKWFADIEEAEGALAQSPSGPWYYRVKAGTAKIFRVTKIVQETCEQVA